MRAPRRRRPGGQGAAAGPPRRQRRPDRHPRPPPRRARRSTAAPTVRRPISAGSRGRRARPVTSGPFELVPLIATPSNAFKFGRLKRNKAKGTAVLSVTVPGPRDDRAGRQGDRRQTGQADRRGGRRQAPDQGQGQGPPQAQPDRQGQGDRNGHLHPDRGRRQHAGEDDEADQARLTELVVAGAVSHASPIDVGDNGCAGRGRRAVSDAGPSV